MSSSPWADGRKTISELNKIACLFVVILNRIYLQTYLELCTDTRRLLFGSESVTHGTTSYGFQSLDIPQHL